MAGGVAVALQFGITDYWMNSYWGGAAAAIGGCLLLGALGRLLGFRGMRRFRAHTATYGTIVAVGVAVLLNSRPWEGMMIMLPAGAMFYYALRIIGNPLQLPYVAVHKAHSVVRLFVWQSSTPAPHYHHAVMERFYTQWETHYQSVDKLHTWGGWTGVEKTRLRMAKNVLFSKGSLVLCALFLGFVLRRSGARFLAIALAAFMIGLAVEGWAQIHYFGPVIGAAAALKMLTLRRLSAIRFGGRRLGLALASALLLCGGIDLLRHLDFKPASDPFPRQRAGVESALEAQPGAHVALVRYAEDHNPIEEWVYNKADTDTSKVIWARDMSPQEDQRLFDYFKGRHFWLLTPDADPLHLTPLEVAPAFDGKAIYSKAAQPLEERSRAARP
jgi:hypothetical protein